jgi:hypothetical protein
MEATLLKTQSRPRAPSHRRHPTPISSKISLALTISTTLSDNSGVIKCLHASPSNFLVTFRALLLLDLLASRARFVLLNNSVSYLYLTYVFTSYGATPVFILVSASIYLTHVRWPVCSVLEMVHFGDSTRACGVR